MKMLDPASLEEMVNVIEAEKEALEKEKNKQKEKQWNVILKSGECE